MLQISKTARTVVPASKLLGPCIEIYVVSEVGSAAEFLEHFSDASDAKVTPSVWGVMYARADYKTPAGILRYQARIVTEDDGGVIPPNTRGFRPGSIRPT